MAVCPLSVLSNWQKQIQDHVVSGGLTCYTYHGDNKSVSATTLASYDVSPYPDTLGKTDIKVVLSTHNTVATEVPSSAISSTPSKIKKPKTSAGPLSVVRWKRIVADEGHVLKNPRTKSKFVYLVEIFIDKSAMQAFAALQAEIRWVATGTPIVNSPGKLFLFVYGRC
jgi:SWI/SNF-related matrix-associated actin-dependent regulator of chromatin subfamily A3